MIRTLVTSAAISTLSLAAFTTVAADAGAPHAAPHAAAQRAHRPKEAAPLLEMLVPGFHIRTLPLGLTNLVNLQYRHDGVLVALGYNGNIWLLRDTDADGLEDQATLFWEGKGKITAPIGMDLAPQGTAHGDAVFFACQGKVMMVTDRNGDGQAEETRVLAEGWPLARAGIDAASTCFDPRDGSLYFGLGVRWYDNAYEIDDQGRAHNTLESERGAILRLSPDFKTRERLVTGVRWPIGLRFNAHHDLFCTDQEGATWLPNGNPFDELLLIEKNRHYGFPPRHPKHLPQVIDEPSVFDYGPQHQSTCGLRFIESINGGPTFGPPWWAGDALIAGQARGKIWRTKLVKSAAGYVAHTEIIASLNQLAVDLTLSPRGTLLVATHSGDPDWGTGPEGKGTVFEIAPAPPTAPQPVLTWSENPEAVKIAWDQPLDPAAAQALLDGASAARSPHVRAGDRLESMWPGYEIVQRQKAQPATPVPVLAGHLSTDRRTLTLQLPPQSSTEHFAFTLPGPLATDLHTQLTGVETRWRGENGTEWQGWTPHLDTQVTTELTAPSPHHQTLRQHLAQPGELTLRTRLHLWNLMRPAVQPGASLDYEPEPEQITLALSSPDTSFTVRHGFGSQDQVKTSTRGQITHDVFITFTPAPNKPLDLTLSCLTTSAAPPTLRLSWHTQEDSRPRPLPLHRFLLPWARPDADPNPPAIAARPEIQGGDWARGREIFFSERGVCSQCHRVRGVGSALGPDLSNLVSRDYASVWRDIHDPAATLNPDYLTHQLTLRDGRSLLGVPRDDGPAHLILAMGPGTEVRLAKSEIASSSALKTSLMPPKLDESLGPRDFRDLMAFLLTEPPLMGVYAEGPPPPRRSREEIATLLSGAPQPAAPPPPLKILLVSGPKDHGTGEHDYPRWRETWARLFSLADQTTIDLAFDWPTPSQWETADAVVFFRKGDWSEDRARDLDTLLARGGGAVFIHWAVEGGPQASGLASRLGYASNSGLTRYRHGLIHLDFQPNTQHPITRNFSSVSFIDETYWNLVPSPDVSPQLLASATEEKAAHPQCWVTEPAIGGRLFVTLGGHYSWTFDDPVFRTLVLRGLAWSTREPVDRFNNLIAAGLE
jgi:putative heme-binding domain-containing protein